MVPSQKIIHLNNQGVCPHHTAWPSAFRRAANKNEFYHCCAVVTGLFKLLLASISLAGDVVDVLTTFTLELLNPPGPANEHLSTSP